MMQPSPWHVALNMAASPRPKITDTMIAPNLSPRTLDMAELLPLALPATMTRTYMLGERVVQDTHSTSMARHLSTYLLDVCTINEPNLTALMAIKNDIQMPAPIDHRIRVNMHVIFTIK